MGFGKKRRGFTKSSDSNLELKDTDLDRYKSELNSLKNADFAIKDDFEKIKDYLNQEEKRILKLCKLLYCIQYKKEMFLHLGAIIESKLNTIINLYQSENWRTPLAFTDKDSQNAQFASFIDKKSLDGKANDISRFNLFNNQPSSDIIKARIKSFRFLRNYGGHSKSVNEFLNIIVLNHADDEIRLAFTLIKLIKKGTEELKTTPPSNI